MDADSAAFEVDDEAQQVTFTAARARAACIVAIPAFAEAYVALGPAPEGFWDDGEDVEVEDVEEEVEESLVAADLAPGITEDGPGWLTHPVDTDRLRDYWVSGPGAAKIGWGTPGDFNRCRLNVAEYVKPQHLNGYCANRHFDALGFWPGQHHSAKDSLGLGDVGDVISLTASGGHCAPSEWFEDPKFSPDDGRMVWFDTGQVDDDGKPIGQWACPQTITEDGQIFGHVAGWKMCHSGWADQCILPPHSATGYAHFLLGEVLTDKGPVAVGNLTIGGGHAGPRASLRAAVEHYDSTSSVFADVAVGEDEFGIWFAGWIRPGTPPEMVHAARASKVSGDWRRNPSTSSLEMIAALAVNVPGYRIPRVAAGLQGEEQISLVAAGVVDSEPVIPKKVEAVGVDLPTLASLVAQEMTALQARKDKMLALSERVNGKGGA